ncbi:hypothetical protein NQ317_010585 [Molorchus minor]|uniref:Dehydrogenase/reductase SDR family member 4 n=1 Tax=Molorchus minor TaxID=1323400 RepID=A0ABQ9IPS0_9CUCU|nr:hypothetical protein NQ317_010585 [Molorchus minor]
MTYRCATGRKIEKDKNVQEAVSTLSKQGLDVKGLICHVSKAEDRKRLFEVARKSGGLDILVSNAAVNPEAASVLDCSESSWDKIFAVNVKAAFLLAKEALPLLGQTGFQPFDLLGAYSVSKAALFGLTKAAAIQLAPDNITVNAVAPGISKNKIFRRVDIHRKCKEEVLSRVDTPHDISGAVAFLASDDAAYANRRERCYR